MRWPAQKDFRKEGNVSHKVAERAALARGDLAQTTDSSS